MRVIDKSRRLFLGTHKGASIQIEREPKAQFYIIVHAADDGTLYDGWAPESVRTMAEAKREAIKGACL